MSARTRTGHRIALCAAATLSALFVAEVVARLVLPAPQTVRFVEWDEAAERREFDSAHPLQLRLGDVQELPFYRQTPAGRRMRAGARLIVERHRLTGKDVEIRTNSLGYRNPELGPKTMPRALFLGDSITLASHLDEPRTWVRRTERLARRAGLRLEAINAGIDTVGLEDELAILLETGLTTKPDLVILGFYLNDVQDSRGVEIVSPPRWLEWSRLCRHVGIAWPTLLASSEPWLDNSAVEPWRAGVLEAFPPGDGDLVRSPPAFHREIQRMFADWGCAWSDEAWRRMHPLFVEFERLARAHEFRLVTLCFPVRAQVEAEYVLNHPQQRLAKITSELGVPLLDLLPPLRAVHHRRSTELFHDQCHLTEFGNELVAQEVFRFLRPQLP
jgi:hypothetical protein